MSDIHISQEERQRIIQEIEDISGFSSFGCDLSEILLGEKIDCQHKDCSDCTNEIKEKLLALIKQVPAQNLRAAELADKLEQNSSISEWCISYAIARAFGYDEGTVSSKVIYKKLVDVIRNLDSTQWPLDRDGVEIKPGDTVYMNENKYVVQYIAYGTMGAMIRLADETSLFLHDPKDFTHTKPRTLEDIKEEAYAAYKEFVSEEFKGTINVLLEEAYEFGRKASRDE